MRFRLEAVERWEEEHQAVHPAASPASEPLAPPVFSGTRTLVMPAGKSLLGDWRNPRKTKTASNQLAVGAGPSAGQGVYRPRMRRRILSTRTMVSCDTIPRRRPNRSVEIARIWSHIMTLV